MSVVISAPHGYCPDSCAVLRQCDCVAAARARHLHARFQAAGIASTLLIPLTPRAAIDFNRRPARNSLYRQALRRHMLSASLVLDIHSYPGAITRTGWALHEAIILEDRRPTPASTVRFSEFTGIPLDPNGGHNDIQDEAHALGIEAFLIEFNETGSVVAQHAIIERIVAWTRTRESRLPGSERK